MQDIINFLIAHWLLSLAFVLVLALIVIEDFYSKGMSGSGLSPQAVVQKINHEHATIIDVRDEVSFKHGHIINAMNIPLDELEKNLNKLNKYKTKPVILIDEKGQHVAKGVAYLKKNGFQTLYTLAGGLTAWKVANLPTEGKDTC